MDWEAATRMPRRFAHARTHEPGVLIRFVVLGFLVAQAGAARCEERFALGFFLGASKSLDTRFELTQSGYPTIEFTGSYESRSFDPPLYWAARFSWLRALSAWELQIVHNKVHLVDPPPEIQSFEVSHGFNLLTANYAFRSPHVDVRFGAGIVFAHPESVVRGYTWSGEAQPKWGYVVTGPAFLAGAGRAFRVAGRFAVVPEAMLSVSRARVPVPMGDASFWDVAFHLLLGAQATF